MGSRSRRVRAWSFEEVNEACCNQGGTLLDDGEGVAPGGPVRSVALCRCGAEAEATKADWEVGLCKDQGGQRVVRAVEELCEAPLDRGVICGGVMRGSCRVDRAELVGIAGAATVEQEQPRTLEVWNGGDSFEEGALFG